MLHFTLARLIVAALVSISTFVRIYTGIDLGIDETIATMLVGGVLTVLAFIFPSFRKKDEKKAPPSSPSDPE